MKAKRAPSKREPTIALINIVFLMLVFFMVAGTLTQTQDKDVKLVRTADLEGRAPPDALVILEDGAMTYRAQPVADLQSYLEGASEADRETLRLIPDRALPAAKLVAIANEARRAGVKEVYVITERALK